MKFLEYINGETVSIILFFIGFYGLMARRNIIRTIISFGIIQSAIILFFVTINFNIGDIAPIGKNLGNNVADPLPQALMITAIVIGVAVTAVSLTMFITLYHKYGTTNWQKVKKKRVGR
ncbi:sodium:proton antiporter [Clostridium grantii]|uniref:Multisubunit sodium/proton antiporter, MrpC subunit (TC 2.A.63.1) n=1 Tax=Clostridium grantii DSM 8605 TaxID=1121316 RepID=A0A1M5RML2_9CLOT|nr:cation:proton antiporter subunit C [Clostridium grantii]SHH27288.1 multisubunit sodium/proton antiporter, MrpC subunit (TC 2.A.63.1) [Clostridium grantii DSM 8605]